jgi:hypothetical protein
MRTRRPQTRYPGFHASELHWRQHALQRMPSG